MEHPLLRHNLHPTTLSHDSITQLAEISSQAFYSERFLWAETGNQDTSQEDDNSIGTGGPTAILPYVQFRRPPAASARPSRGMVAGTQATSSPVSCSQPLPPQSRAVLCSCSHILLHLSASAESGIDNAQVIMKERGVGIECSSISRASSPLSVHAAAP